MTSHSLRHFSSNSKVLTGPNRASRICKQRNKEFNSPRTRRLYSFLAPRSRSLELVQKETMLDYGSPASLICTPPSTFERSRFNTEYNCNLLIYTQQVKILDDAQARYRRFISDRHYFQKENSEQEEVLAEAVRKAWATVSPLEAWLQNSKIIEAEKVVINERSSPRNPLSKVLSFKTADTQKIHDAKPPETIVREGSKHESPRAHDEGSRQWESRGIIATEGSSKTSNISAEKPLNSTIRNFEVEIIHPVPMPGSKATFASPSVSGSTQDQSGSGDDPATLIAKLPVPQPSWGRSLAQKPMTDLATLHQGRSRFPEHITVSSKWQRSKVLTGGRTSHARIPGETQLVRPIDSVPRIRKHLTVKDPVVIRDTLLADSRILHTVETTPSVRKLIFLSPQRAIALKSRRGEFNPLGVTRPKTFSTSSPSRYDSASPKLTHVSSSGSAHMVSVANKDITSRTAIAVCRIRFSNEIPLPLIISNQMKKGDVLGVARVAGIMAAKRTPDLIPLCHPISITKVSVELDLRHPSASNHELEVENTTSSPWAGTGQGDAYSFHKPAVRDMGSGKFGSVEITATVSCDGKTGVEMEALTAASTAALTVYDMCKAVDKGMWIEGLRVVKKEGGKSGDWTEE